MLAAAPTLAPDTTAEILEMLTYARPAWSRTEEDFIARYVEPSGAKPDGFGNYWVRVGQSAVLWSSHTDTVHHAEGRPRVDTIENFAATLESSCLGADCTAGAWVMLEMIRARVPGLYLFHRAEEIGGLGSSYIAKNYAAALAKYKFAVAFDRRGTRSIITHQMGARCASEAFSKSITPMLPPGYRSDDGGSFTDTANYTHIISECTNLSVGYAKEHSPGETLDLRHLLALRDMMVSFDESKLVSERAPNGADDYETRLDYGRFGVARRDDDYRDLLDFCRRDPETAADFLETNGFTVRDLEDWGR
jgi:hypothetical protein